MYPIYSSAMKRRINTVSFYNNSGKLGTIISFKFRKWTCLSFRPGTTSVRLKLSHELNSMISSEKITPEKTTSKKRLAGETTETVHKQWKKNTFARTRRPKNPSTGPVLRQKRESRVLYEFVANRIFVGGWRL